MELDIPYGIGYNGWNLNITLSVMEQGMKAATSISLLRSSLGRAGAGAGSLRRRLCDQRWAAGWDRERAGGAVEPLEGGGGEAGGRLLKQSDLRPLNIFIIIIIIVNLSIIILLKRPILSGTTE
jgi:hypothetical protein